MQPICLTIDTIIQYSLVSVVKLICVLNIKLVSKWLSGRILTFHADSTWLFGQQSSTGEIQIVTRNEQEIQTAFVCPTRR